LIRFERFPIMYPLYKLIILCPFFVLARLFFFSLARVYSVSWSYFSIYDVLRVVKASLPVSLVLLVGRLTVPGEISIFKWPYGVITLEASLTILGCLGARMIRRIVHEESKRNRPFALKADAGNRCVLLIGAGDAGNIVAKELIHREDIGYRVAGFVDDDPQKVHKDIQGIKVLGKTDQIPALVRTHHINEAIITIGNAGPKDIRRIVDICQRANLKVKIIPGLGDMLDDRIKIAKIRELDINDLLGRSEVRFDDQIAPVKEKYRKRRILVTGAGGSIGSELCRQLVLLCPEELVMIDKDENSIYEIDMELAVKDNGVNLVPIIANIKNRARIGSIVYAHRPEIIFHAAAHKHVPLMEANKCEAVLNNIGGTKNMLDLAVAGGVECFINISTDKAINPTSVMGATKRVGEMLVQSTAAHSAKTRFSCVRFGNVLGSRGSVIPLFQRQIAEGGPLTITHPDIQRYFMSISEAVQLIIQAGTLGSKGEIFVLDMGKPIKILGLAKDLIKLSGYTEDDIEIKYIGLRPGEKLYEELLIDAEKAAATKFKKIFIAPPGGSSASGLGPFVSGLLEAAESDDETRIIEIFRQMDIGFSGGRKS
jgi:FlaA1/EpsC-like NDP-sugar epimerase